MFSFLNDYSEGACKEVLDALIKTNDMQLEGYGLDEMSLKASSMIKKLVKDEKVDIHFIPGGTPCNMLAVSLLKPYEAVICVKSGHINVHETGAVESTGHKIIETEGKDGKVLPNEVEKVVLTNCDEHTVKPKMVFISNSTEYGNIYTKKELMELRKICDKYKLYLYLDGARLANALVCKENDLDLKTINKLCDLFYLGATKNGSLIGEALIIKNDDLKEDFRRYLKRNGSMLAKTRIISIPFIALLENDIYLRNARNANKMAQMLKKILLKNKIKMYIDSPTNQLFVIMDNKLVKKIQKDYLITYSGEYDKNHSIIRFVTSFATKEENIQDFERSLNKYLKTK